jgi:hypothetical protein
MKQIGNAFKLIALRIQLVLIVGLAGGVTTFLVAVSYPNSNASIIIGLLVSAFNLIAIWRLAWDLLDISNEISEIEKAPTEVRAHIF